MTCAVSHVVLTSARARELATAKYTWIMKQRENAQEQFLRDEVERINSGWFRRLFRMKPVTREDVLAAEEARSGCFPISEYMWAGVRYSTSLEVCEQVLRASRYSDQVTVSLEDLERLT